MLQFLLLITWVPLICDAVETFSVVVPQGPISAHLGSRVTLPCWLSPDVSAETMEVRWYRKDFQTPALLYREKQLQGDPQDPQYKGRVSLDQRNPQSGGLKAGDVSLKLENVTLADEGEFVCYVRSDVHYDAGRSIHLYVTVIGSIPVLSAHQVDDVTVNVSCSSSGWHPQPSIIWSNSQGTSSITPGGLKYSDPDQGLVSVSSWILTSPSDSGWFSCSVSVPEGEKRESWVAVLTASSKSTKSSNQSGQWKAAFIAILCLVLAASVIAALLFIKKRRDKKPSEENPKEHETEPLLPTGSSEKRPTIDMDQLKKGEVDVILDEDAAHLSLKIRGNGKIVRDSADPPERQPTEKTFTSLPFVQGKEGFTSGCAYWEVGLANPKTGLKNVWSVGLVSESAKRDCEVLSSENGFWVLTLDGDNGLHVNTKHEISICKHLRIQTLGVYLDYDRNMISFYNVEEKSHLITLFTEFRGKVYPLFSPRYGDQTPLRILSFPGETPATSQGVDQSSNNHHQPQPNTEQSQTQPDAVSSPPATADQALSHTPQPETSNETLHS